MAGSLSKVEVPVVDLDSPSLALRDTITTACETWGIFSLVNHDIGDDLIKQAFAASTRFFARPLEDKQVLSRTLDNPWGYYDRELTKNLRDRKEIFDFGQGFTIPWPADTPDFEETLQALSQACYKTGLHLLELLGDTLGAHGKKLRTAFEPFHSSFTRLNHYPVADTLADSDAPLPGPLGISRHTDAGGLTVLLQDEVSGLQAYSDGWCDIKPLRGALTINIGDMLQVWSNDRFHAPLHRVRASEESDRYSIAYFLNPARESVVEPLLSAGSTGEKPLYRAVPWAEFRDLRAQGDYGDYGEEVQISHYRL